MNSTGAYRPFRQSRAARLQSERYYKPYLLKSYLEIIPKDKSVIDLGAGVGKYIKALRDSGFRKVVGIDATENICAISGGLVTQKDLTEDCSFWFNHSDWALFIDVGEHVPRGFESRVIVNVSRIPKEGLIVSWGLPGVRGSGHVNCRTSEYVASRFALQGWLVDDDLTVEIRKKTGKYYSRCLMVMKR